MEKITPKLVDAFPKMGDRFATKPDLVEQVIALTKGTSATLFDVPRSAEPLFRPPNFDRDETKALFAANAMIHTHFKAAVAEAHSLFSQMPNDGEHAWTKEGIHQVIAKLPKLLSNASPPSATATTPAPNGPKAKVKKAAVLAPLRFAISASERGAPLADLFLFLGRDQTLQRLQAATKAVEQGILKA